MPEWKPECVRMILESIILAIRNGITLCLRVREGVGVVGLQNPKNHYFLIIPLYFYSGDNSGQVE